MSITQSSTTAVPAFGTLIDEQVDTTHDMLTLTFNVPATGLTPDLIVSAVHGIGAIRHYDPRVDVQVSQDCSSFVVKVHLRTKELTKLKIPNLKQMAVFKILYQLRVSASTSEPSAPLFVPAPREPGNRKKTVHRSGRRKPNLTLVVGSAG